MADVLNTEQNKHEDEDYIIIPNPIYDVVFRYLMEDIESAKIVLSTLIGEKILKLQFEPLSHAEKQEEEAYLAKNPIHISISDPKLEKDIKLFHLDFTATIELSNGEEELVMIELQKANVANDIWRFKRYIAKNFQKKQEKERINPSTQLVESISQPIRLIPIFILNFKIENEIDDLLIRTNRIIKGVFKDKELAKENGFIGHLTYDIWVVQLPNLHKINIEDYQDDEYKSKLYALLKLFDQKSKVKSNEHRLRIIRRYFPEFLSRVIRRLSAADVHNQHLEEEMYAEDEYLQELIRRDNTISFMEQEIEKKDKLIEIKEQELEQKEQLIENTKQELEQKEQLIENTKQELEQKEQLIEDSKQELEQKEQLIEDSKQELEQKEQLIENTKQELEQKEQLIENTKQELEQKEQLIENTKQELEQKEQLIENTKQELEQKEQQILNLAKMLKENHVPTEQIQKATGLSKEEIEKL